MWWFAWVHSSKGPTPVKFDADVLSPVKDILINYRLNDEEKDMSIDELTERYPYTRYQGE